MPYYTDAVNMLLAGTFDGATVTGQSLTGGSADSTNVIDLQATPTLRDMGIKPMYIRLVVTTAFTAGGGFTSLDVAVRTDSTTNLDTSETTHATRNILLAALTLGAEFFIVLPPGQTYERYLGLEFTTNGAAPGAGAIAAALVPSIDSRQYFADGSNIQ